MQDELLTIGRFARLCRLSVKQLRHRPGRSTAPLFPDTGGHTVAGHHHEI
ncbi:MULTISPECIES: hypothetical protein [unclassified Streptomyces]|nr:MULTISPECIES: hypothetical protein [unclassified Streptomyces]